MVASLLLLIKTSLLPWRWLTTKHITFQWKIQGGDQWGADPRFIPNKGQIQKNEDDSSIYCNNLLFQVVLC